MKASHKTYTCKTAAEVLNVTPDYVRQLCNKYEGIGEKIGRDWMLTPRHVKQIKKLLVYNRG